MNIKLLIYIITDIVLFTILILLSIETFVFQKALQKQGIDFVINLEKIISKNELKSVIDLLERENENYKGQGRRIVIFGYMYQYLFFYLVRLFLACIFKQKELQDEYKEVMKKDSKGALPCGGYLDRFDTIEIYAFNLKKLAKDIDTDVLKIELVYCIAHEFRHRIQYNKQISVIDEEADAEGFATDFCIKNKYELQRILNLSHVITLSNTFPNS